MMKFRFLPVMLLLGACSTDNMSWTEEEKSLINAEGSLMRVLTVETPEDIAVLRTVCDTLNLADIQSPEYAVLAQKMLDTVQSPEQDGVGIAGPQVGISRRVVAVMRYDKDGRPFEVYPNIRITDFRGEKVPGPEGCLSVPGRRGDVPRYQEIDIHYTSPYSLKDTVETVTGFSAVIFQHECDHLDGVIYTDYLD